MLPDSWAVGRLLPKSDVFYVKGRFLYDNDHSKVVLRGINLPLLDDWDFPKRSPFGKLEQLAKTGANAVRIQWYAQYPDTRRDPYAVSHLDAVLEKCRTSRLIPIVELHDCTCKSDPELVNTQLMSWWTRSDVVPVLKRHQQYLIINLANELGEYRWQNWSATALHNFKNAYKKAITLNAFRSIGQELINHDTEHSILLSAHAYWGADYDGTPDVDQAVYANLPIVFGEIANKQFANGEECYYALDGTNYKHAPPTGFRYQSLLILLTQWEIGWLAWAWYKDNCEPRRMTLDGNYSGAIESSPTGLTPCGVDILHPTSGYLRSSARLLPALEDRQLARSTSRLRCVDGDAGLRDTRRADLE